MALSDAQKKSLGRQSVSKLLQYIQAGNVSFPDDFTYVDEEKINQIKEEIAKMPNPKEVEEWNEIRPLLDSNSSELADRLKDYISHWETSMPEGNHVEEAAKKLEEINRRHINAAREAEQREWDNLDLLDKKALENYIAKYPKSIHKDEIDDAYWDPLTIREHDLLSAIENDYLRVFPDGKHYHEAQNILREYRIWEPIKISGNIYEVFKYVQNNPRSPLIEEARDQLLKLKKQEIKDMKELGPKYSKETLLNFLKVGIFSENELLSNEVATRDSLQILKNFDNIQKGLPNIDDEIQKCRKECAEDRTDVFLFGIPSTGKSCILMGLIGSTDLNISYVKAGGPYAAALEQYLSAGVTIGQTPADFIATLEAEIPNGNQTHKINLVEMAGEDFAYKLASNENGEVSFEDMGNGAAALLSNGNRKAFFLIVDPTSRVTTVKRRKVVGYDGEGNEIRTTVDFNVNQRITLKRMVDLFDLPENANIMQKVDSIHILVTKSDTLGNDIEREEKALNLFMSQYRGVLNGLAKVCNKYGINVATDGFPKLYTFSLGNFYVGGIYQYDDTDANKLVNVIRGNVWGDRNPTFFDKLRYIVNKPII